MSVSTEQAPVDRSGSNRSIKSSSVRNRCLNAALLLTLGVSLSLALTHAVPIFLDGISSAVKHLTVSMF